MKIKVCKSYKGLISVMLLGALQVLFVFMLHPAV